MNKKVWIYAYTKLNLGDDLFIKILCDRYPNVNFFLQSEFKYARGLRDITNLTIMPKIPYIDGLFRRLRINLSVNKLISRVRSKKCDGIVVIGGSIFIENHNWLFQVKAFKRRYIPSKPFYIIGANFGPYNNLGFRDGYREIFNNVTDVCFREKLSHEIFSDLNNVRWESDVVFSLDTSKIGEESIVTENPYIIISLIDLSDRKDLFKYKEKYLNKILELSYCFINKGFDIVLMSFCKNEGDSRAINEFNRLFQSEKKRHLKSYEYNGFMKESLSIIKNSTYLVGSRFHAMILGLVLEKPVFSLTYSNKSINVINDLGINNYYTEIKNIEDLNVDSIYEKLSNFPEINLQEYSRSANNQFLKLDQFLK